MEKVAKVARVAKGWNSFNLFNLCNRSNRRLRRAGFSLVELLVAILLIFIVFAGWMRMNNIQAVNKESLRYAAVEKAAGMLDAIDAEKVQEQGLDLEGTYLRVKPDGSLEESDESTVLPLWQNSDKDGYGYQCHVLNDYASTETSQWGNSVWIVVDLFDNGIGFLDNRKPFTSLRIYCSKY